MSRLEKENGSRAYCVFINDKAGCIKRRFYLPSQFRNTISNALSYYVHYVNREVFVDGILSMDNYR